MAPKDEELTAFRTPKGIYCYKVMPFGLKNVGATYQSAMQNIFDDILHKNMKCYVDDLVVKSRKKDGHLQDLRMVFEWLRRYQLRMNPLKCAFGVTSRKFSFLLFDTEVSKLIKLSPIPGKPLILYISAQERSVGALLAQGNNEGKENELYYLSRMMTPNELKYSPIEKLCLALVFSIQKLKHYFQAHVVRLISRANHIKFVMSKPVLSDRLARWYLQFQQFEIVYVPQKALSDKLPDEDAMVIEIQPPWKMYFDGAAHRERVGTGIVFITSQGEVLPYSFTLTQQCFNNVDKYQVLILGLEMAVDIKQFYKVKKPDLVPYHKYAQRLVSWLGEVTIQHVPRKENKRDEALSTLASTLSLPDQTQVVICQRWIVPPPNDYEKEKSEVEHLASVLEVEIEDWRQPLIDYLCYGILPENPRRKTEIQRRAPRFLYYKDTLYRRSFDGVLLCYLGTDESLQALQEAHSGGLDVVGTLPKSYGGHLYILAATDYFSKWAEVISLKEVKKENVAKFIRVNIIYRFGIPRYILTDNSKPFDNKLMNKICDLFGFKQRNSSMYYAAVNGLAEVFNKALCNLLKMVISKSKRGWHERMEEALWAYRTTYRTPTQATPYSLVYRVEAVLPLERQIPSLRLAIQEGLTDEENARLHLEELEALDEKSLEAQHSLE
uniref:Integrase catalytic domain-containing protein n=1 Tax=Nicotiana tabacum TaxID=4097 RepID=A0A1S3X6W5_TOBAC|nr:PREDICTED: uncharacterized protein LOC107761946 [Nicotiana tabacum]